MEFIKRLANNLFGKRKTYDAMGHRTKRILRIERKEYQTY